MFNVSFSKFHLCQRHQKNQIDVHHTFFFTNIAENQQLHLNPSNH